jgi:hypothetical protein
MSRTWRPARLAQVIAQGKPGKPLTRAVTEALRDAMSPSISDNGRKRGPSQGQASGRHRSLITGWGCTAVC